jgi:hypothetical protein
MAPDSPRFGHRQSDLQTGAAFGAIGGGNGAAMLVDNTFRDSQAQTCPVGVQAARNESFKNIG